MRGSMYVMIVAVVLACWLAREVAAGPPAVGTWKLLSQSTRPQGRMDHELRYLSTNFLMFGGWTGPGGFRDDFWIYSVLNGTWKQNPKHGSFWPKDRADYSGCVANGDYWVFGGGSYPSDTLNNVLVKYTLATDSWSNHTVTSSPPISPRNTHASVCLADNMLVFGGDTSNGPTDSTWSYSYSAQSWSQVQVSGSSKPSARLWHTANAYDNKMYVFGGLVDLHSGATSDELWIFDPATSTWTQPQPSQRPPRRSGHVAWVYKSGLYIQGGQDGDNLMNDMWVYDIVAGQWVEVQQNGDKPPPMVGAKADNAAAMAIMFGGSVVAAYPNQMVDTTYRFMIGCTDLYCMLEEHAA